MSIRNFLPYGNDNCGNHTLHICNEVFVHISSMGSGLYHKPMGTMISAVNLRWVVYLGFSDA